MPDALPQQSATSLVLAIRECEIAGKCLCGKRPGHVGWIICLTGGDDNGA